jgi:transcriptional regulator with XRE-family HTH domain
MSKRDRILRLQEARRNKALSLAEMARRCNFSQDYVTKLLGGRWPLWKQDKLERLEKVLGIK